MHIITRRTLVEFYEMHSDAKSSLEHWYMVAKKAEWKKFADVRGQFGSADQVGRFTVFNIAGNKYRLIATIHYNRGRVYIRHILTHREYDEEAWKE